MLSGKHAKSNGAIGIKKAFFQEIYPKSHNNPENTTKST